MKEIGGSFNNTRSSLGGTTNILDNRTRPNNNGSNQTRGTNNIFSPKNKEDSFIPSNSNNSIDYNRQRIANNNTPPGPTSAINITLNLLISCRHPTNALR